MWLLGDNYDKMKAVKFLPLFSAPQMVPPIVKNGDEVSCPCHCLRPFLSLSLSLFGSPVSYSFSFCLSLFRSLSASLFHSFLSVFIEL